MRGLEATKLISFSFMSEQKFLGSVKVHLHHSTRTIQIQGSSIMPDSSRAAVWFLKNLILVRFKDQAKAKNFSIRNTNAAILTAFSSRASSPKISTKSSNSCLSCNSLFDTRSKPSKCVNCGNFLHKTNCLKDHMKVCHLPSTKPPSSAALVNPTVSSFSSPSSLGALSRPNSGTPTAPGFQSQLKTRLQGQL